MIFSCVIPVRDEKDPMLADLIRSIRAQDFPQDEIEIITVTEGDSEQAKGIGIRRAKGDIIGMFCVDNKIMSKFLFGDVKFLLSDMNNDACFPANYWYDKKDNSLNRYFSLMGGNDPVCWFLGKNDRSPHVNELYRSCQYQPSYGCNGFFYRAELIKATNLDHYYPMDNASEIISKGFDQFVKMPSDAIWHRTSDNLFTFLKKRYKYARDLYCDRKDRRWKMLDGKEDYWRLSKFIGYTLTGFQPLFVSLKGFLKIRDPAWFWHWPVCLGFLITYGLLVCRNILKHRSLYRLFGVQKNSAVV